MWFAPSCTFLHPNWLSRVQQEISACIEKPHVVPPIAQGSTTEPCHTSFQSCRYVHRVVNKVIFELFISTLMLSFIICKIFKHILAQGLFLDTFPPYQLNSSWRFPSFFGIWLEFFQDFARVLSFFTKNTLSFFGNGIYSMEYMIFMSNKECIMDFDWKKLLFRKL